MSELRPVGDVLDGLGVQARMDPEMLVSSAVVLLEIVLPDGSPGFKVLWSQGQSYITRRGLLELALDCERISDADMKTEDAE